MLRHTGAVLTALFLAVSSSAALAADTTSAVAPSPAPLAPGSAAGIHDAQHWYADNSDVLLIGAGVIAIAAVVIIADNHDHHGTSSTGTAP